MHVDRVGLAAARNAGLSRTAAPVIAFTDDDCVVPPSWLERIEDAFVRHPAAELMYGQTLEAPEFASAPGVVPQFLIKTEELFRPQDGFRTPGMGADFAVRRQLVERVGGFDEALGAGGPLLSAEDLDFQFRALRAGARCLYTPAVWVHHRGLRSPEQWPATQAAYGIGDAAFYLKHIRCGDLFAARLLVARLARLTAKQLLNPIRRKPTQWPYLRSYLIGMRRSFSFRIDRKNRLYRLSENVSG
jgi:GT2 family glycosyltransferase